MVDADQALGPERVRPGDVIIAMGSSGLHSNGFSLVRRIIDAPGRELDLAAVPAELGRPLGEELLEPTRIYARDCLALAAGTDVHAFAHVTGGGLAANLARVLPGHADAVLDRGTWRPGPVFGLLARHGEVPAADMERVFNMGVGMVAVVAAADADRALRLLAGRDVPAWVAGDGDRGQRDGAAGRTSSRLSLLLTLVPAERSCLLTLLREGQSHAGRTAHGTAVARRSSATRPVLRPR